MEIPIYNLEGNKAGIISAAKEWADVKIAKQAMKDAVVLYLSNQRQGNSKAKDRSEINFTTKKPWAQKGTGRARSGTASSPIWRKGGVVFGPKPRDYSIGLPKKVRKLALKSALSEKLRGDKIIIVEKIVIDKPATKSAAVMLQSLKGGRKPLIVTKEIDKNVKLSFRNIPGVDLLRGSDLNAYSVLSHRRLIIEKDAWEVIETQVLKG